MFMTILREVYMAWKSIIWEKYVKLGENIIIAVIVMYV